MNDTPQLSLFTIVSDDLPPIVPITNRRIKDLAGQRFGRLAVFGYVGKNKDGHSLWICHCDCGQQSVVVRTSLISGLTNSCGCLYRETIGALTRTHGLTHTPEYRIWAGIKTRCLNPHTPSYDNYGGRGITMCDRWLNSFECFLADMGPRPNRKFTVERIDNDLGYSPDSCRWATYTEQANNKRGNHLLTFQGETLTISQWAQKFDIPYSALASRVIKLGWTTEKALTTPYGMKTLEYQGERLAIVEWSKRTGITQRTLRSRIESGWPVSKILTTPVRIR